MGSEQNDYTSFFVYDSDSEPEPRLCVTGCGFYAGAYSNLCSKCSKQFKKLAELEKPLFIPFPPNIINETAAISERPEQQPTRCLSCNKKFGLMGFKCKCGKTFCGIHRYPETHECKFDFKGEGRDAIGKANPALKPDKVEKI